MAAFGPAHRKVAMSGVKTSFCQEGRLEVSSKVIGLEREDDASAFTLESVARTTRPDREPSR